MHPATARRPVSILAAPQWTHFPFRNRQWGACPHHRQRCMRKPAARARPARNRRPVQAHRMARKRNLLGLHLSVSGSQSCLAIVEECITKSTHGWSRSATTSCATAGATHMAQRSRPRSTACKPHLQTVTSPFARLTIMSASIDGSAPPISLPSEKGRRSNGSHPLGLTAGPASPAGSLSRFG